MVTEVFAGLPVDDFDTALAWYRLFVNRAPDMTPKAGEAVWRLAGTGWICVVADEARAGSGLVTLLVDDLEHHVGSLALRGIAPQSIETVPGVMRTATIVDPAGNTITLGQRLGEPQPA
jgi:predicted enzyme related to lactoylglutathione lyase